MEGTLTMSDLVSERIEANYEAGQTPADHPTLRASSLGEDCDRKLWYRLRWAVQPKRWPGRMLRLFETGNREEIRIVADLAAIGCKVTGRGKAIPPLAGGSLTGSIDGKVIGVPGAEDVPHLLEAKTHSSGSWNTWRKHGVRLSHPRHYTQMQVYMHGLGLKWALYAAHNKNTDELKFERVAYDPIEAGRLVAKAERIAEASDAPPRIGHNSGFFKCLGCEFSGICHGGERVRRNCRTCMFASEDFDCLYENPASRSLEQQAEGCDMHLYNPSFVQGEQIDADKSAKTVTYRLRSGAIFVDGKPVE